MFFFGYAMANGLSAILCSFLWGMMMFGVMIGVVATMAYGLDAFRSQSNEMFVMNMVFKVSYSQIQKNQSPPFTF